MIHKEIEQNGEIYQVITDYKDQEHYRHSLNRLTKKTFGFDFEDWYRQGYWTDRYRPYSLLHRDQIVANVSVNPINFLAEDKVHRTLQIGTVMTEEAYRQRGLARVLMTLVLEELEKDFEMIYLYANDTVLDFYPRFGFRAAEEYNYGRRLDSRNETIPYRKLDLNSEQDKKLITRLVTYTRPQAAYSMLDNPYLDLFYLTSFMAEDIYYFEELDLAAVATFQGGELILNDVFCMQPFDLELIINSLRSPETSCAILGFTPVSTDRFEAELLKEEGSTFFVKGNNFLKKGRFPVLSHA